MNLHSWEYWDLTKEMNDSTMFELLQLYKTKHMEYGEKCLELIKTMKHLNKTGIDKINKECEILEGSEVKIALEIAGRMTEGAQNEK